MQITLNLKKTLEQSANAYFERAKKSKAKIAGAQKVVAQAKKELEELDKRQQAEEEKQSQKKAKRPLEWFEKFRWFISSEGFLCIGGRDATSNEVVIKKHTDSDDVIFHTDMPGSPFFVIKTGGKKPGEVTLQEVADATAIYSKAWKLGIGVAEVFHVTPAQVSKQAPSGEYMVKGAFMITGRRNKMQGAMNAAVGVQPDGKVMAGPLHAVEKHCKEFMKLMQGKDKPSDCAKKISRKIGADIDDIVRVLPAGTCQVK